MVILLSFVPKLNRAMALTVVHKRHLQAASLVPSAGPSKGNITENKLKSDNIFRASAEA
jgi:hypothetical protein